MKKKHSPKPDRVIMVLASREAHGAPAGGIHRAVLAHIAALRAKRVEVTLLTASEPCAASAARMGAKTDVSPVWHNSIKPLLFPRFWVKLIALRIRGDVRCVIHHSGRTWLWGHLFFWGIPQVQVFHRELVRPYRYFRRWLALSPGFAEVLADRHSLGGFRKIAWAPNCLIQEPDPPPTFPKNDCFTIGFLGRSGAGKGIDTLLAAVARMKSTGHRVEVRFGGEGESYITPLAKRLNVEDYVKFTGWHSNPNEFIDQLDLLVLPSVKESFGLVIIEAMAREKPVLATRCHGPSSIIVDGKTGYLIPISDEAALAKKMIEAMEDSDLTAKGKAGFIRVLSHYTPSNAGTKLIEALTELGVHFENERTK